MKTKKLCLTLVCALFVAGCNKGPDANTPVLKLNDDCTALVWDPVEGALSYELKVDEYVLSTQDTSYEFSTSLGGHKVSVTPILENEARGGTAKYEYTTVQAEFSEIYSDGEYITWDAECFGMEYAVDDGDFTLEKGERIAIVDSGVYTVRTADGLKESNKTFYTGQITKTILGSAKATATAFIEDGSTSDNSLLNEQYRKTKFDGNWVATSSTISLDNDNLPYTTGTGVVMQLWHHGIYFMYEKDISIKNSYKSFTFKTKANSEGVNYVLSFQITKNLIIGGVNLNGVYLKYPVNNAPLEWTEYTISMEDPNWKINYGGNDYAFDIVANMIRGAGFTVNSICDLFPLFDVFQFRIRATYDNNGYKAYAYFDDVALLTEEVAQPKIEKITPKLMLAKNYAFESDAAAGNLSIDDENSGVLAVNYDNTLHELPVSLEKTDINKMRVISTVENFDFDATLVSNDGGNTMSVESATGSIAALINNARLESISLLDNFESYESTGQGYDENHKDETQRSGLRGAYFADFYNTDSNRTVSPIGGENWRLMGSTDYCELSTTIAHTGNKSFSLKSNSNTMRFMTYALKDGATEGYRGKYFSFWVKGGDAADATLAVSVYSTSHVTPSNQIDNNFRKTLEVTIAKDSKWTEYRIDLDITKTYYGFAFTTKNGSSKQYINIDDVYIFNDLSPWGN